MIAALLLLLAHVDLRSTLSGASGGCDPTFKVRGCAENADLTATHGRLRGSDVACTTEAFQSWVPYAHAHDLRSVSSDWFGQVKKSKASPFEVAVQRAATDETFLRRHFKTHRDYARIIPTEMLPASAPELARWSDAIQQHAPQLFDGPPLERLQRHNRVGGPLVHRIRLNETQTARLAPSMLKYAAQAAQMQSLFGRMDGFHVVEIGVGYGGLAHTLMSLAPLASYTFVDLADVERLARRYLQAVDEGAPADDAVSRRAAASTTKLFFPELELPPQPLPRVDLVISNNALSETPAGLQHFYLALYAKCATRGYIINNSFRGMNVTTMRQLLQGPPYDKLVRLYRARANLGDAPEVRTADELRSMGKLGLITWGVGPEGAL